MRKWLNLSIRSRLLLGFGIAAFLTLVIAVVAIVSLRSLGQNLSSMAERDRLLQTGAIELRLGVEQESDAVRGYLLTGNKDFLNDFAAARTQYSNKLAQLRRLVPPDEAADLLSTVDASHTKFVGIADEQTTLRDMGFSRAAVFLWQTQGNEVKISLDDKLSQLVARQETVITGHTAQAKQEQNETLVLAVALVSLTWIVMIVSWVWTSRSITRPISQLLRATEDIGRGKLDTRIEMPGRDELGLLSTAMNRMVAELDKSKKVADDLYRREQRRADQMRTINEVGRQISSILSLDELLPFVVDLLHNTFHYSKVTIFLVDPVSEDLVLKATQGSDNEQPLVKANGHFGDAVTRVAKTGETFLANDSRLAQPAGQSNGINSELAVAIRAGDQILGVLEIQSGDIGAFDEADVFAVSTLADQLAVAVHNARLYERGRELAAFEERQRLARELHDAVTQTLFSASLIAEVLPKIWEKDRNEGHRRLEELRLCTRGALAEMRMLLLELRPASLAETRLEDSLRQLSEAVGSRARVPVKLSVEGELSLPPDVQLSLYRIAQEALNNVVKHSRASEAKMRLVLKPDSVELTISDNGIGFDPGTLSARQLGLRIMRERAETIGARIEIESRPGSGTRIGIGWQAAL